MCVKNKLVAAWYRNGLPGRRAEKLGCFRHYEIFSAVPGAEEVDRSGAGTVKQVSLVTQSARQATPARGPASF